MKGKGQYQIMICDVSELQKTSMRDDPRKESYLDLTLLRDEVVGPLEDHENIISYEIKSHDFVMMNDKLKLTLLLELQKKNP